MSYRQFHLYSQQHLLNEYQPAVQGMNEVPKIAVLRVLVRGARSILASVGNVPFQGSAMRRVRMLIGQR
jgi:hypothetical protein